LRVRRTDTGEFEYTQLGAQPLFKTVMRSKRSKPVYEPATGGRSLINLLTTSPSALGWKELPRPRFPGYLQLVVTRVLSSGATSTVYATDQKHIIKIVKPEFREAWNTEQKILTALAQHTSASVPQLLDVDDNSLALLMAPKGYTLQEAFVPTSTVVKQLIDVLQMLHGCNWIHRDIRPANLLLKADKTLLLVDYGFAQKHGEADVYSGTIHYASDRVLGMLAAGQVAFSCTPADDLESAARSLFILSSDRTNKDKLESIPRTNYDDIRGWWKHLEASDPWKKCLITARNGMHQALALDLAHIFPMMHQTEGI